MQISYNKWYDFMLFKERLIYYGNVKISYYNNDALGYNKCYYNNSFLQLMTLLYSEKFIQLTLLLNYNTKNNTSAQINEL